MFDPSYVQHATAETAPFIKGADSQLASRTLAALKNIQQGLDVKGATYSILRVFASYPGKPKPDQSLKVDLDGHPLASLNKKKLEEVSKRLNRNWFQSGVQHRVNLKRAREEESDLMALHPRKRRRTDD